MISSFTPPEVTRIVLAEGRRRGLDFDASWELALGSLPRRGPEAVVWRETLEGTRGIWERAFDARQSGGRG
jgi:hypothetical protein